MADEEEIKNEDVDGEEDLNTHSPLPTNEVKTLVQMDFYDALRAIAEGKKVTKLEWGSNDYYALMDSTFLMLHKTDGKLYFWKVNEGDMIGKDYFVLE